MLPQADATAAPSRSRKANGIDYLKNEHLTNQPQEAKILAVKYDAEHKFGPSVVLKLAFTGKIFFWTVEIKKNPNYKILLDQFGPDENDWAGQKILIALTKDEWTEKYFPRVSFPKAGK